jgi:hypothetical protein
MYPSVLNILQMDKGTPNDQKGWSSRDLVPFHSVQMVYNQPWYLTVQKIEIRVHLNVIFAKLIVMPDRLNPTSRDSKLLRVVNEAMGVPKDN